MNSSTILAASLLLAIVVVLPVSQAKPVSSNNPYQAISSLTDISGQPVRQRRATDDDYYICYPSSVVYGYQNSPNALEQHRRSSYADRQFAAYDSYDARTARADRERAAYTDSFGR
ncbi:hypothetical protein KR222_004364 [Zaprionus bogoriensis]|nr:hypothetical protein KR222_004364 [Zaprionus bogoriensis]